jgi:hypothetical protein
MTYTKKQFAQDLKQELQHGFNVNDLSQWAYQMSVDKYREIEPSLDSIIQQIAVMGEGPEFEFSEQELLDLISELNANV